MQLHLVTDKLTTAQILRMSDLSTVGGSVPINGGQTIGSDEAKIVVPDVTGTDGYLQVLDNSSSRR